MKHLYSIKILILCTTILFSCSSDDTKKEDGDSSFEFETEGAVQGTLNRNGEPIVMSGNYTMENDFFEIKSPLGLLKGPVTTTEEGYRINFENKTGFFEGGAEITGTIILSGSEIENLIFDSQYLNGSLDIMSYAYLQSLNLKKSVVYFAHDLVGRKARVELEDVNGQALDFLGHHYEPTDDFTPGTYDFCHMEEAGFIRNADTMETGIVIYDDDTWPNDEDNPYVPVIRFVVDKETYIDYTVYWDNGYVEQGRFYSDIGGAVLSECIGSGAGPNQEVHAFYETEYETYDSTVCFTYLSDSGCTAGKTNMTMRFTEDFGISITDLPEDNGMYQFTGNSPCNGFSADVNMPDGESHIAFGGYLIKESGNSIEFKVEFDPGDGNTHVITGYGTYLRSED